MELRPLVTVRGFGPSTGILVNGYRTSIAGSLPLHTVSHYRTCVPVRALAEAAGPALFASISTE